MTTDIIVGDSLSNPGLEASSPANTYVARVAARTGRTFNNLAIPGGLAGDMASRVHEVVMAANNVSIVQLGTNEQHAPGPAEYYKGIMRSIILALAAPARVKAFTNMSANGATWGSTRQYDADAPYAYGLRSYTAGDKVEGTFYGDSLYVTVLKRDIYSGYTIVGTANVFVDGNVTPVGNVNSCGTAVGNERFHITPYTYRFSGFGPGQHSVKIELSSDIHNIGGLFYVEGVAGSEQPSRPMVCVGNVPRWTAAGYAAGGGSDTIVASLNADVANLCAEFIADGFNVRPVNTCGVVLPTSGTAPDGYHWNDLGHANAGDLYGDTIIGPAAPPPVDTLGQVVWSGGKWYAQTPDGQNRREIA